MTRYRRTSGLVLLAASALLALTGCTGEEPVDDGSASGGGATEERTLRVFAAASLTESFETLRDQFEDDNPGVTVELNFGPSSGLAEQITGGAPADVFASASTTNMQAVVDAGDAADPTVFATNSLEIAVPPGNPGGVTSVDDLADPDVTVAVCAPDVPCGVVAQQVFENAGVDVQPATEEVDVKSVLTKVTLDEADAGLVYVTDVQAAGDDVEGVEIPADVNATTDYPIAVITGEEAEDNQDLAQAWVDLVLSDDGTQVLQEAGFAPPTGG